MPESAEFPGGGGYHSEAYGLADISMGHNVDDREGGEVDPDPNELHAAGERRHHYQEYRRDQPPGMILYLFAVNDAHDHGIAERDHHHDLDGRYTVKEPRPKRPKTLRVCEGSLSRQDVPMHHTQGRQADT